MISDESRFQYNEGVLGQVYAVPQATWICLLQRFYALHWRVSRNRRNWLLGLRGAVCSSRGKRFYFIIASS